MTRISCIFHLFHNNSSEERNLIASDFSTELKHSPLIYAREYPNTGETTAMCNYNVSTKDKFINTELSDLIKPMKTEFLKRDLSDFSLHA